MVFAEGPSDAHLLSTIKKFGRDVDFRSADEIDIAGSIEGGNRTRVMRLAERATKENIKNLTCLIDSDFDYFFRAINYPKILYLTDYSNVISGSISFEWISGFLLRGFNVKFSEENWKDLESHLKLIFISRCLCHIKKVKHSNVDLANLTSFNEGRMAFKYDKFLNSFIQTSQELRENLKIEIEEYKNWLVDDARHFIHSSDFFHYIYLFLRKSGSVGGAFPQSGARSALLGALPNDLGGQNSIAAIVAWIEA